MIVCPFCGRDNRPEDATCHHCGTRLMAETDETVRAHEAPIRATGADREAGEVERIVDAEDALLDNAVGQSTAGVAIDLRKGSDLNAMAADVAASPANADGDVADGAEVDPIQVAAVDPIEVAEAGPAETPERPDDGAKDAVSGVEPGVEPGVGALDGLPVLRSGELLRSRRYMILRSTSSDVESNAYVALDLARRVCHVCGLRDDGVDVDTCSRCGMEVGADHVEHPEVALLETIEPSRLAWADVMTSAGLAHDALVQVRETFEHTPYGDTVRTYAVMDVEGGTPLSALTPPLGPRKVVRWGARLAEALAAMHGAGVVHGSLRLGSVRVIGEDVMLTGFERATALPAAGRDGDSDGGRQRAVSTESEVFNDSVRGDIVALGAMLQSLLPRRGAPAEVTELIARAIGVVPGRTFGDSGAFAAELGALADRMSDDTGAVVLRSGTASDVGRVRELNEDCVVAVELNLWQVSKSRSVGLYAVADGMGGHDSGEVASGIAVRELAAAFLAEIAPPSFGESFLDAAEMEALLLTSCRAAGRGVYDAKMENASDMGATVVAALVCDGEVFVAHAGDSRAYRVNETGMDALTCDHTLVQQWVDEGRLSPDEARTHPRRNLIYRQVGEGPDVNIDITRAHLAPGDWLLLCSDGLSGMVRDVEILSVVRSGLDPQSVCDELVRRANLAGGDDNISVVAVTTEHALAS